jgi:hypothetical protein
MILIQLLSARSVFGFMPSAPSGEAVIDAVQGWVRLHRRCRG